ncbi:MAG: efflux RND transporter periplasmic adaptor subunit [Coriobacteriia bacterium]|nr:efflux RND transporter periplasmic adaptor subunit [Coriobacteriia bacterium]
MSRGKIIAAIVALLVIGGVVAGVMASASAGVPEVSAAKAVKETLDEVVTASGKVEASTRGEVYAPTAGTIASVDVVDGAVVKAGQSLAIMDTKPLTAQVRQAEAGYKGALAQLDGVNKGIPAAVDKSAANAGVSAASAGYSAAKSAYDSFYSIYHSMPATVQPSMEGTLTQLKIAKLNAYAGLENARSGRNKLTVAGKMAAAKASAQAGVSAASAALALARETLSKATLTAPIDGVVIFNPLGAPGPDGVTPKAATGAALAPGSAAFTVVSLAAPTFDAQVDEADIDKIKDGMKATISLDAFPSDTFDGTVKAIRSTAIQTTTGGIAFPVYVEISPKDKRLLLGMSGSVDIQVNAVSGALTVPIEAVLDESGKKYVFVIDGGVAKKVEVTTGALTDTRAEIVKGLTDGQTVATNKLSELKDGMTVRAK